MALAGGIDSVYFNVLCDSVYCFPCHILYMLEEKDEQVSNFENYKKIVHFQINNITKIEEPLI